MKIVDVYEPMDVDPSDLDLVEYTEIENLTEKLAKLKLTDNCEVEFMELDDPSDPDLVECIDIENLTDKTAKLKLSENFEVEVMELDVDINENVRMNTEPEPMQVDNTSEYQTSFRDGLYCIIILRFGNSVTITRTQSNA